MSYVLHEQLHRGPALMQRLETAHILVCGAGALGANLVEHLARCGARRLSVIDRDRVEPHNLSTQPYGRAEVGAQKAKMLANRLYRDLGVKLDAHPVELNASNARKLLHADLVVDTFDNTLSRQLVKDNVQAPCLHAGMTSDYAEILWNEAYRVPRESGLDGCDYPLARTLVSITATLAAEALLRFLATGERLERTFTLQDLVLSSY